MCPFKSSTKEHKDPKNACCNVHTISNPHFSVVIDNSIVHFAYNPPLFNFSFKISCIVLKNYFYLVHFLFLFFSSFFVGFLNTGFLGF
jgi:hypothetical protein